MVFLVSLMPTEQGIFGINSVIYKCFTHIYILQIPSHLVDVIKFRELFRTPTHEVGIIILIALVFSCTSIQLAFGHDDLCTEK